MTPDDLHGYLALFRDNDWSQLTVSDGDGSLHISRTTQTVSSAVSRQAAGAASPRPPQPAGPSADPPPRAMVKSHSIGVVRFARQAGAAPAPGERVTAGDWLADIIVADRTESILSPADGVVASRLAADGEPVEYNQPLIVIQP